MSYQVLARKWRPNRFAELVGQEHVVSAISNALDNNRLHHAYLFTGTRGVGKTTIARIFSKSLNCEQGLGANPCGQCGTCQEIEHGNFIDLLEIDAASRTKVEDTRELLDNVQYKPSRGRYKVYLIDEVHMLSKHSFNALLKTLEEPPPHVKFLLATTDPQKLPVTILSRCLQFNLKALSRGQITKQLEHVLGQESLQFELDALIQLARAAQGSMRDALSLTDQAIAQGNGAVSLSIVTDMLGLMDKNQVLKLLHAVVQKDSQAVMQQVEQMANQAPDFGQVLSEIMSLLHQVALTQFVPDACKLETLSAKAMYHLAKSVPVEQVQLLYQIALSGKKDLPYAADPRTGLEMTLLRMLAFSPDGIELDPSDLAQQAPDHGTVHESVPMPSDQTPSTDNLQQASSAQPNSNTKVDAELPDAPEHQLRQQPNKSAEPQSQPSTIVGSSQSQPIHSELPSQQTPTDTEKAALYSEQDAILQQAEQYGHQTDYDGLQPVDMYSEPVATEAASNPDITPSIADSADTSSSTSTSDLIALRNRLKQNQLQGEDGAGQVKKSDPVVAKDVAAAPTSPSHQNIANVEPEHSNTQSTESSQDFSQWHEQYKQDKPEASAELLPSEEVSEQSASEPLPIANYQDENPFAPSSDAQGLDPGQSIPSSESVVDYAAPPWDTAEQSSSNSSLNTLKLPTESNNQALTEPERFDPNAHLDEDNVGEVTMQVPAFLDNKQKVVNANQLDQWSQLIDQIQVSGLTKQLALHSSYELQGNKVILTLLAGKEHLDTPIARQILQQALCQGLNMQVELEIITGQPINTPYALQIKINQVRHQYARQVVQDDPGVQLLKQRFAAQVDEQSIQAR